VPPRRLLVISYPYPPMPSVGGNRWLAMAKYLRRRGHHVDILTTSAFGALPDDAEQGVHRAHDLIAAPWLRTLLRRPALPKAGEVAAVDKPPQAFITHVLVPDHNIATWVPFAALKARRLPPPPTCLALGAFARRALGRSLDEQLRARQIQGGG